MTCPKVWRSPANERPLADEPPRGAFLAALSARTSTGSNDHASPVTVTEMTTKSTPGRDRTAAYRVRLAASHEPPAYVVANAIMAVVAQSMLSGERPIEASTILSRASAVVTSDGRYEPAGFDNVISRLSQQRARGRRLA